MAKAGRGLIAKSLADVDRKDARLASHREFNTQRDLPALGQRRGFGPRDRLVRAIRGPVILITVGVLFAFDTMSEIRFSQTWPVLLIVMGVLWLGEHLGSKNA